MITRNGNVGIEITNPSEKLEVSGSVKATGFKTPSGTANQALTADGGVSDLNLKADLVDGKVPSSQLPSYVDDVLEFANLASFPATGESGKIYIAIDTNITYRWTGTGYAEISASLALGETASTAYRGDRGKIAYDHSQVTHDKNLVGLGNVDNTSDLNKPISNATQLALNGKQNVLTNPVTGTGTTNRISKFTASGTIGDSQIFDNGTNVGIGTTSPQRKLHIANGQPNLLFDDTSGYPSVSKLEIDVLKGTSTFRALNGTYGAHATIFSIDLNQGIVSNPAPLFNLTNSAAKTVYGSNFRVGVEPSTNFVIQDTASSQNVFEIAKNGLAGSFYIRNNGNVGIGTTSPQAKLDIKAQGALSTDIAFRVRNSTDTANLLSVNGEGTVNIGHPLSNGRLTIISSDTTHHCIVTSPGTSLGFNAQFRSGWGNNLLSFTYNVNDKSVYETGWVNSDAGPATKESVLNLIRTNVFSDAKFRWAANDGTTTSQLMMLLANGALMLGTTTNESSAQLQMDSTTRGFLPPRMTTTQRNAIASPAAGLIVYDTTDNKHYGFNGTTWNALY